MLNTATFVNKKPVIRIIGVGSGGHNMANFIHAQKLQGIDKTVSFINLKALEDEAVKAPRPISYIDPRKLQLKTINDDREYHRIKSERSQFVGLVHLESTKVAEVPDAIIEPPSPPEDIPEIDNHAIEQALEGADVIFIVMELGEPFSVTVAPLIADIAKKQGTLTICIGNYPFPFQGHNRQLWAQETIDKLTTCSDIVLPIGIEKILFNLGNETSLAKCFGLVDEIAYTLIKSIIQFIENYDLGMTNKMELASKIKIITHHFL